MKTIVTRYKGFVIAYEKSTVGDWYQYNCYTKDEWSYGKGYRTIEIEADSIEEAKGAIDSY